MRADLAAKLSAAVLHLPRLLLVPAGPFNSTCRFPLGPRARGTTTPRYQQNPDTECHLNWQEKEARSSLSSCFCPLLNKSKAQALRVHVSSTISAALQLFSQNFYSLRFPLLNRSGRLLRPLITLPISSRVIPVMVVL